MYLVKASTVSNNGTTYRIWAIFCEDGLYYQPQARVKYHGHFYWLCLARFDDKKSVLQYWRELMNCRKNNYRKWEPDNDNVPF